MERINPRDPGAGRSEILGTASLHDFKQERVWLKMFKRDIDAMTTDAKADGKSTAIDPPERRYDSEFWIEARLT